MSTKLGIKYVMVHLIILIFFCILPISFLLKETSFATSENLNPGNTPDHNLLLFPHSVRVNSFFITTWPRNQKNSNYLNQYQKEFRYFIQEPPGGCPNNSGGGTPNKRPSLTVPGTITVQEKTTLVTNSIGATDDDVNDTLTFSLGGIDAGKFRLTGITTSRNRTLEFIPPGPNFMPAEDANGDNVYNLTITVDDNQSGCNTDSQTIDVTIIPSPNQPPILGNIGNQTVNEGSELTFAATATDPDEPAQTLSFSLDVGAPGGATIHPSTGVFRWTPTEAQGPGTYSVTVRVTDGTPAVDDHETINITVREVNERPSLHTIGNQTVNEGSELTFAATATDPDEPAQTLSFSLDVGAPGGATIHPSTGVFRWTPTEAQGPGTYSVTVRVTDGTPAVDDHETINITVNDVADIDNTPPSAPQNLDVTSFFDSMTLQWDPSTDNVGVQGYQVSRNTIVIGETSNSQFTDTQNLQPSTTYFYSVSAFDAAGNISLPSTAFHGTTLTTGCPDLVVESIEGTKWWPTHWLWPWGRWPPSWPYHQRLWYPRHNLTEIKNIGTAISSSAQAKATLITGFSSLGPGKSSVRTFHSLAPGESITLSFFPRISLKKNRLLVNSQFFITVSVDPNNSINECREDNNTKTFSSYPSYNWKP